MNLCYDKKEKQEKGTRSAQGGLPWKWGEPHKMTSQLRLRGGEGHRPAELGEECY